MNAWNAWSQKQATAKRLVKALKAESIDPEAANAVIVPRGTSALKQKVKLFELLVGHN